MNKRVVLGYGCAIALTLFVGAGSAEAFVGAPIPADATNLSATPVAMCGRSCRSGGRYIPGPPEVCEENGLNYCGPSRGGPGPGPGVGVVVPGGGVGVGVGPGGVYVGPTGNCRTITIQRDDGSVRRIRRCD
jgi:hypothetical protein